MTAPAAEPLPSAAQFETIRLPVAGMVCASCVGLITRTLKRLPGVSAVHVDLGREAVTVRRERGTPSDAVLAAALSEAGYRADLGAIQVLDPTDGRGRLGRWFRRAQ